MSAQGLYFVSKSSKKVCESYQTHFLILKLADGEIGRRSGNFLPLAILQKPFLLLKINMETGAIRRGGSSPSLPATCGK